MSRPTQLIAIDRDRPDPAIIDQAAQVLQAGGLVAFATETVYGLGALATDPAAVARIFAAKGRPSLNPLIVHAADPAMARGLAAHWPVEAERLARAFWPGPLTLVLPRAAMIPDVVTAGRATVGLRVPAHPVALALIERTGGPLAAPSANRSTRLSPTQAQHVRNELAGAVDLILDSGPTQLGLESTVLDLTSPGHPRILRPGLIAAEALGAELGKEVQQSSEAATEPTIALASPGLLAIHYAPRTPAIRVTIDQLSWLSWPDRATLLVLGHPELPSIPGPTDRVDLPEPATAARDLYAILHRWDAQGLDRIVIVIPPEAPAWRAIHDRLRRATRPIGEG